MEFKKIFRGRFSYLYKKRLLITLVLLCYILIQAWHVRKVRPAVRYSKRTREVKDGIRHVQDGSQHLQVNTTKIRPPHGRTSYTYISPISARVDNTTRAAFVFMPFNGRFGNNLFQYASAYSIARDTSRTVVIPEDAMFSLNAIVKGITAPVRTLKSTDKIATITENGAGKYTPDLLRQSQNDISVCCFLQSWRYFTNYRDEILEQFAIRDVLVSAATKLKEDAINLHISSLTQSNQATDHDPQPITIENITVIGVHVRRGDFTSPVLNSRGYVPAPSSYFHMAMEYFRSRYDRTLFIVTSDHPAWSVENLMVSSNGVKIDDLHVITQPTNADFALLVSCDHIIMSVGSYGWWAGWLGGGTVVYYSGWPIPGTVSGDQYQQHDFFPPSWISIGDWLTYHFHETLLRHQRATYLRIDWVQ